MYMVARFLPSSAELSVKCATWLMGGGADRRTPVPLYSHLVQVQDVDVGQHFEQLDLAQSGNGESILLVVNENLFEGDDGACSLGAGLGYHTKGSFTKLLCDFIFFQSGASSEAALGRVDRWRVDVRISGHDERRCEMFFQD